MQKKRLLGWNKKWKGVEEVLYADVKVLLHPSKTIPMLPGMVCFCNPINTVDGNDYILEKSMGNRTRVEILPEIFLR